MYVDERSVPQLRQSRHSSLVNGDGVRRFEKGRRCTAEGCDTVLSRYNPSPTCATHAGWRDTKERQYG